MGQRRRRWPNIKPALFQYFMMLERDGQGYGTPHVHKFSADDK